MWKPKGRYYDIHYWSFLFSLSPVIVQTIRFFIPACPIATDYTRAIVSYSVISWCCVWKACITRLAKGSFIHCIRIYKVHRYVVYLMSFTLATEAIVINVGISKCLSYLAKWIYKRLNFGCLQRRIHQHSFYTCSTGDSVSTFSNSPSEFNWNGIQITTRYCISHHTSICPLTDSIILHCR